MNPYKISEYLWLAGIVVGLSLTGYFLVVKANDSALFFLGFFIISILSYYLRRRQRIRHDSKQSPKQKQ